MNYTLSDFDYSLPESLIAQKPAEPRDHSKLLVYNRSDKSIKDEVFYNIGRYLHPASTLVLNNSKVEKARLLFGNKEVFIVQAVNNRIVEAMVRPGKKFRQDSIVELQEGITARVLSIAEDGLRTLEFDRSLDDSVFDAFRHTPFPPYIKPDERLSERYQTIYAKPEGSKAAPTAGLHFTDGLIRSLHKGGIKTAEVTLHVGLGTFAPVKTEVISSHKLHQENWFINHETAQMLNNSSHITAVGTTSARVLESQPETWGSFKSGSGTTEIFIRPGYTFRNMNSMITNFHLPKSTLLMMIAAFMGYDEMKRVYSHAIDKKYRFYSFGDAMLIL